MQQSQPVVGKIQITNRYAGRVLFECDEPAGLPSGMRVRHALEKATQARAYLAGAYLADAYLAGANLAGAYLADAYLAGANLADANLAGANLAGAYLAGANLAGAYLADAYLAGANLAGAYLAGANLADAYLAGAYLAGAKWRDGIVINKPPIQVFGLHWRVTILDAHMQIGCELHRLSEWEAFDDRRICEMSGKDALRFWAANKVALLAMARGAERDFSAAAVEASASVEA